MTRFGAHAFIWESEWTPTTAQRIIQDATRAELDFVEIPLLNPQALELEYTTKLLKQHGMGVTCSLGLPTDASLPEHPHEAESFLKQALEVAAKLGAPVLTGVVYGTLAPTTGHPPREDELDTVAKTLKKVAKHASTLGMSLGLEPVNRYETHLINLASQALEMLERIDEPNAFLHLDTYHMNIEEKGFRKPILEAGKHLKYIHLSESDRGTPGSGNVPWQEVFTALAEVGYTGDLVMESFAALNADIARATCIWRPVVENPERLVEDGLAFLRQQAKRYKLLS